MDRGLGNDGAGGRSRLDRTLGRLRLSVHPREPMLTPCDLLLCLDAAKEAARAGAAVLQTWRSRFSVKEKGRFDLVTEADLGSQKAIYEYLQMRFPAHAFLGE